MQKPKFEKKMRKVKDEQKFWIIAVGELMNSGK